MLNSQPVLFQTTADSVELMTTIFAEHSSFAGVKVLQEPYETKRFKAPPGLDDE